MFGNPRKSAQKRFFLFKWADIGYQLRLNICYAKTFAEILIEIRTVVCETD